MAQAKEKQKAIWEMFNKIAPSYDKLNHILSIGIDKRWRQKAAEEFRSEAYSKILDAATGTGDLLFTIEQAKRKRGEVVSLTGIDMAENLLTIAKQKAVNMQKKNPEFPKENSIEFRKADATLLPYGDASFDGVSIAFGIRNIPEYTKALSEFYRILRNGGKLVILEFGIPKNFFIRFPYLFYFRKILPFLGGVLSGEKQAYRYLNQSVEHFPYAQKFSEIIQQAGFYHVKYRSLSGGIAYLYVATKNR
ncbi:MAG: bifunctional demethylmenaquinone methyltransferase/2-methoxy-6-polyprenyl-1,4-benzoquinol methylase UbiE [Candidatus Hydrogenedentota bacterium]|nr:MAG: bifunctional demethylmenaquinone methyltransferase/2-methoxy-6-polyprenyl-1,4-benzoquinol methylase UbiE [Candidatus Hydrogenedentota bacterium]